MLIAPVKGAMQQQSGMQQQQQQQHQQQQQQQQQQPSKPPRVDSQFTRAFVAGGGAGMLAALVTCPVEVVKTKLQAPLPISSTPSQLQFTFAQSRSVAQQASSTITSVTQRIYSTEGFRGFFKGVGPLLFAVVPARAVYFASYAQAKTLLGGSDGNVGAAVHLSAASVAGIATATAINPLWVVKTRLQIQDGAPGDVGKRNYSSTFNCFARIAREEGYRAFYKGMGASYLGVAETAIQFVVYENLRARAVAHNAALAAAGGVSNSALPAPPSGSSVFAAAAFAKFIACVSTYPHEVLRTRLREQRSSEYYRGIVHCTKTIIREEGFRGLYSGLGAHLIRVVPNSAIMFLVYEAVVSSSLWGNEE